MDKKTGFLTRNILCCPIKTKKGVVVGVAQLINKRQGGALSTPAAEEECLLAFTVDDQRFLLVFASQVSPHCLPLVISLPPQPKARLLAGSGGHCPKRWCLSRHPDCGSTGIDPRESLRHGRHRRKSGRSFIGG